MCIRDSVAAHDLSAAAIELQNAADQALRGEAPAKPLAVLVAHTKQEILRVVDAIIELVPAHEIDDVRQAAPAAASSSRRTGGCESSTAPHVPAATATPAPHAAPNQPDSSERAGAAEASDLTVLHWREALEHFGGEEDILRRLLRKFCDRAGPTMESLQHAIKRGSMEALRREAHSLSGSCAYIAAASLQAATLSLEDAAEQGIAKG
eukprot:2942620-Prymnesium_polylepis.1